MAQKETVVQRMVVQRIPQIMQNLGDPNYFSFGKHSVVARVVDADLISYSTARFKIRYLMKDERTGLTKYKGVVYHSEHVNGD